MTPPPVMVVVGLSRGQGLREMEILRDGRKSIREPEDQVLEIRNRIKLTT